MSRERLRCAVVGCGAIGRRLATRLRDDPDLALAVVLVKPGREIEAAALFGTDRVTSSLADVVALRPAVAVECAGAGALAELGPVLLRAGIDLVPLSLGAFADREVERRLRDAAEVGPGRIEVPAGAVGALGLPAAAREDRLAAVELTIAYPTATWRRMGAVLGADADRGVVTVFRGSVREAATRFAGHLNVSVGVALAGRGLDATGIVLVADPSLTQARFEIALSADPGDAVQRIEGRNAPLGADPADYTTFSLLHLLRRRMARLAV